MVFSSISRTFQDFGLGLGMSSIELDIDAVFVACFSSLRLFPAAANFDSAKRQTYRSITSIPLTVNERLAADTKIPELTKPSTLSGSRGHEHCLIPLILLWQAITDVDLSCTDSPHIYATEIHEHFCMFAHKINHAAIHRRLCDGSLWLRFGWHGESAMSCHIHHSARRAERI